MSNHDNKNANYGLLTQGNAQKRQLRQQKQRNVVMAICLVFTLVLCLYLCLIIGSIRDKVQWNRAHADKTDDPSVVDGPGDDNPSDPAVDTDSFTIIKLSQSDVHKGLLLQIDAAHLFDFSANVNMSNDFVKISNDSADFQLYTKYDSVMLYAVAYDALKNMCADFHTDTGHDDLYIVTAWRSQAEQQKLHDSNPNANVAGASEYHSGFSVGLKIRDRSTGSTYKMFVDKTEYGNWLEENCHKYGYILSDISTYAKNTYFEQTFRYVGKPAATYIHEHNTDLSGYLTALYKTSYDNSTSHIKVTVNGIVYGSYYVPATKDTTSVPVPKGCDYTISGDNVGGFVVTYKME